MANEIIEQGLGKTIVVDIEKEMKKSYLDYSMSVIVGRALPDVRDGLKPVHRRILYTMYQTGLGPDKGYVKSVNTVGEVLGKYHPHGDAAVYDALVRLAQDFSMRYPLVDGHGNFGSVDGDPPAAYRYTEARMSRIATAMLTDIDKETIDYMPNFDDRFQEPVTLPSRFPNLLVNGSVGIAVGMATNIPPHNLGEVVDAVVCLIDNPEATLDDLMQHIKGPDFPTGGIIMGRRGIRSAYTTGRGKITLRSRAEIEEMPNGRQRIVVTELPYMVNKARLIESIADHVKNKKIDMISGLRDESDREGLRIVVELKAAANAQVVLNQLFSYTQLQETVGVIMLAIVDGQPKELSLHEILREYIKFQESVIRRRTEFDLKKAREREHILEGLKIAQDNIDEVIKIIRSSRDNNESRPRLMERFGLSEIQANAILTMQLGRLSALDREKIESELADILAKIGDFEDILAHEERVLEIIKDEILLIKDKYSDERRTEIQHVSGEVDIEDLIPEESCVLTLTHFGYLKRMKSDAYKAQRRGGRGISGMTRREEDFVEEMFICSSHDYVMFFTNRGRVYRLKCYEIAEASRVSRGVNIVNLLPLEAEEKVTSMIKVSEVDSENYLVMVTRAGIIKRTPLAAYKNVRKAGLIAITLDEGDELAWVRETDGNEELIIATRQGMAIKFMETDARPLGRSARGVKAITLREGDEVVGMACTNEDATILTVTEKGYGRRTPLTEYRLQSRGGKGITNYRCNPEKGLVAGIRVVEDTDDIIMITDDGVIIRMDVAEVNIQSRHAYGVRVMRVAEGSRVVTMAPAPKETADEDTQENGTEENVGSDEETDVGQPGENRAPEGTEEE